MEVFGMAGVLALVILSFLADLSTGKEIRFLRFDRICLFWLEATVKAFFYFIFNNVWVALENISNQDFFWIILDFYKINILYFDMCHVWNQTQIL